MPKPLWHNFQGLFRAVDEGSGPLNIWGYNGGLFAPDPIADGLIIPDPLATDLATLGEWDYRSEVPVTVLGHIFEQSVTDIERLHAIARGEEPPKVSKSKRQGIVYTPEIVTRFLVERTIDRSLEERFASLLTKYGKPVTLRSSRETIFAADEKALQIGFWKDYLAALRSFTIVDPACGSGAFLVAAFDLLTREYRGVIELLATLGEAIDFDPFDEIVTKNLYGVDFSTESAEITRLALWLKTARSQHRLEGFFPINKCYLFPSDDEALVALLNSRAIWFCFVSTSVVKRGGYREATARHIGPLPWPDLSKGRRTQLINLSETCRKAASQRLAIRTGFHHRMLSDLAPRERQKLTSKLENFWLLDFAAFRAEAKKAFKTEIAVKDRDDWEKYLAEKSAEVIKVTAEIETAEREIDAVVYKAFDLTPDEIKLLEESLEGQY